MPGPKAAAELLRWLWECFSNRQATLCLPWAGAAPQLPANYRDNLLLIRMRQLSFPRERVPCTGTQLWLFPLCPGFPVESRNPGCGTLRLCHPWIQGMRGTTPRGILDAQGWPWHPRSTFPSGWCSRSRAGLAGRSRSSRCRCFWEQLRGKAVPGGVFSPSIFPANPRVSSAGGAQR